MNWSILKMRAVMLLITSFRAVEGLQDMFLGISLVEEGGVKNAD
jgi:hypothetical protein